MRTIVFGLCLVMLGPSVGVGEQAVRFRPFDESYKDRSFRAVRGAVLRAAYSRNYRLLRRLMHPEVRIGLRNDRGPKAAIQALREDPKQLRALSRILRSGGRFETVDGVCQTKSGPKGCRLRQFVAPYTYFAKLPGQLGVDDVAVITRSRINVRAAPTIKSKIVSRLGYTVVRRAPPMTASGTAAPKKWVEIVTGDNRRGFVYKPFVRSPNGSRAVFRKQRGQRGRWRLWLFKPGG